MSQIRPSQKVDYIRECLEDPALVSQAVPLDEFNKVICMRCGNRQCTRSRANNMMFDSRVANWRSNWFLNVPRAVENDPNYANIRAKNFQQVNKEVLEVGRATAQMMPIPFTRPDPEPEQLAATDDSPPAEQPVTPTPATPPRPRDPDSPGISPVITNTPFQQGIVLPGKPKETSEVHAESGSSFTFGGGNDKE